MGDVVSIIGVVVLLVLLVASVRQVRAREAETQLEVDARVGQDAAQHERSQRHREEIRAGRSASGADPL